MSRHRPGIDALGGAPPAQGPTRVRSSLKALGLFEEISSLPTEAINRRTAAIDEASVASILRMMNREDLLVARAVGRALKHIEKAVEMVVRTIKRGGRVFYVGAGTSGRLGVLDAAECPPTFGTVPHLFQGIIAGGRGAVFRAKEGSEDDRREGSRALLRRRVTSRDVVVGLAACRRTPFVLAALDRARQTGASTIYVTCNTLPGDIAADLVVAVDVGPEALMGSTRLKSGTAEKMVLNMISTASMIRLGKVYRNLMVDLKATSEKLRQRSIRTIILATGCDFPEALSVLTRAKGSVKVAIVMELKKVGRREALRLLEKSDGFVGQALKGKRA